MEAAKSLRLRLRLRLRLGRSSSLHLFQCFIFLLAIVILIMSNYVSTVSAAKQPPNKAYKNYIKRACDSAIYPSYCYKSLSPYASTIKTDPHRLYRVSLYITIKAARKTSSSILKLWRLKGLTLAERTIVRDCAETVSDALDELQQSLKEMANLSGASSDRKSEMVQNLRTWVSSALTYEGTCTDGFDGQEVSNAVNKNIKKTVLELSRMTSNCLALLNLC